MSILASAPWTALAAGLLAKSTLLVAAAWIVTRILLLRRASASARHLVWTLAVCALVLLPMLTIALPSWNVVPVASPEAFSPFDEPLSTANDGGSIAPQSTLGSEIGTAPGIGSIAEDAGPERMNWPRLLGMLYALGVLAALAWAAVGLVAVRRITSRASVVTDAEWIGLLRDVAWELEVRRPVALLRSDASPMPMALGWRRAAILLPAAADAWPESRRRVVLLHEMAHVARRDCLTQAIAALACTLYWFHPGAWYAARQLRVERELACDDRVLAAGTRPRVYASHLLEIARAFRAPIVLTPGAVSMARPSQLEGRLLAVLDEVRSRRSIARSAAAGAALATGALVLPLAALAPAVAGDPSASAAVADTPSRPTAPPLPSTPPAEALVKSVFGARLELQLASAADVRIIGWDRDAVQVRTWAEAGTVPAQVSLDRVPAGTRIAAARAAGRGAQYMEIRVPRKYDLQIRGGGSRVDVHDLGGRLAGSTQGGDLVLSQVGGLVALATDGGAASISSSRLTGQLFTAGGNATVRGNLGDLDVQAGAGTATVEVAGDAENPPVRRFARGVRVVAGVGRVTFHQRDGDILVQDADEGLDVRTGRGSIDVGSTAGHALAHTTRGDVRIRNALNSVDAATGAGDVFVQMLESREATLTSRSGDVTLELPDDFRGVLDITSIATAGNPPRYVRSWFPLDADPVARTGADGSTILQTVASIGGGGPRITLTATDGDIAIRRAPPARP